MGYHWTNEIIGYSWIPLDTIGRPMGYNGIPLALLVQYLKFETPWGIFFGIYTTTMVTHICMQDIRFQPCSVFK